ncbi:MAG: SufD family Fe-S cluster assembly protein [Thermoproteales archaeon]|nr:SufD family Fe-S cluster assembly protein [Thermoproteales archaeon]
MTELEVYKQKALKLLAEKGLVLDRFDFEKIDISRIPKKAVEDLGVSIEEPKISGMYVQVDNSIIRLVVKKELEKKGVVLLDLEEALEDPQYRKFYWKALPVDYDEYTAAAELYGYHGVFLYVPEGVNVAFPVQACFLISSGKVGQAVHNIIVVDKNASLTINTTCAALRGESIHIGVTEMFVGENANLTYIMVHGWTSKVQVRPRTGVIVGKNGVFTSHYINLKPVEYIQSYPRILLKDNAKAYYSSVIVGRGRSYMDLGSEIILEGHNSRGEIISRSIARDDSRLIMRSCLKGYGVNTRGHLECKGLQLSDNASIETIPILESRTTGAILTHEASIGRISEEELNYLMSKGFTEEEATSIVIRGFIDIGLDKIPKTLRSQLESIYDMVAKMATG